MMKATFKKHTLIFNNPAGTSRGVMLDREVWYLFVENNEGSKTGIGEIAPLKNLSCDATPDLENKIAAVCQDINNYKYWVEAGLQDFPSIRFGLETAIADLHAKQDKILFLSEFTTRKTGITINGLIWMGDADFMRRQIAEKTKQGFGCIKLKIGANNFETELSVIREMRNESPANELEIRVDANGAFSPDEAPEKLSRLAELNIHSIEQPIKQGQIDAMADLCAASIIPIALDEELIGINNREDKIKLLVLTLPDYIILKPSLHGGIAGCTEWIEIAESLNIGWWITSALESNIGLNAIAQWTATLNNTLPQGLGTGQLFTNNIPSPLDIKKDKLFYIPHKSWDLNSGPGAPILYVDYEYASSSNPYFVFVCDDGGSCSASGAGVFTVEAAAANSAPAISSVTDSSDPVPADQDIYWNVDWSDTDSGDMIKVFVCKTNAITTSTLACTGGAWATSPVFTNSAGSSTTAVPSRPCSSSL